MRVMERTDTAVSLNASFNGTAQGLEHLEGYSIVASITETQASLAGTIKLQVSNNALNENQAGAVNSNAVWVDVSGSSQNVSGSGTLAWSVSDAYYKYARLVWTRSTGQGTVTFFWYGKGPQS